MSKIPFYTDVYAANVDTKPGEKLKSPAGNILVNCTLLSLTPSKCVYTFVNHDQSEVEIITMDKFDNRERIILNKDEFTMLNNVLNMVTA